MSTFNPLKYYQDAWEFLQTTSWRESLASTKALVEQRLQPSFHGDLPRWFAAIEALPSEATNPLGTNQAYQNQVDLTPVNLNLGAPRIGLGETLTAEERLQLRQNLMQLHPWRKGPLNILGEHINTEWRSDWKWERVQPFLSPLKGRRVLDVGCGNGYYALRMVGCGAAFVVGIDPTLVSVMQFLALKKMLPTKPFSVLPLGIEDLPRGLSCFDSVFSMGVFYHRKSPFDHLAELREALVPGGELILETLVIEGAEGEVLVPKDRYAQMRNVWFLPTSLTLLEWLQRAGFRNIRCVDETTTTAEEQRTTDWMTYKSLSDFLDPTDSAKTVEGYPAPRRAVFIANA
ncbi:MAG: tRNA 5-methoxyuridine(34)/uridine 5-oxyacetic acid(34) synthase CmoB [Sumerlaeia bacterium]